jgi:hypothetical protein
MGDIHFLDKALKQRTFAGAVMKQRFLAAICSRSNSERVKTIFFVERPGQMVGSIRTSDSQPKRRGFESW